MQIPVYSLEEQIPMYMGGRKGGRKEEGNPRGLLITHTGVYGYVRSDLLVHFQTFHIVFFFFLFLFLGILCLYLKSQSLFGLINLRLCMSINILPRSYITYSCLPMPD